MQTFSEYNAFTFVPISECVHFTGKQPIGTRWVDVNKGDELNPDYRSRCVAQELNTGPSDEIIAGTPPLEAKKTLFSLAVSSIAGKRATRPRGTRKLMFIDVKKAYLHAQTQRPVYSFFSCGTPVRPTPGVHGPAGLEGVPVRRFGRARETGARTTTHNGCVEGSTRWQNPTQTLL